MKVNTWIGDLYGWPMLVLGDGPVELTGLVIVLIGVVVYTDQLAREKGKPK